MWGVGSIGVRMAANDVAQIPNDASQPVQGVDHPVGLDSNLERTALSPCSSGWPSGSVSSPQASASPLQHPSLPAQQEALVLARSKTPPLVREISR